MTTRRYCYVAFGIFLALFLAVIVNPSGPSVASSESPLTNNPALISVQLHTSTDNGNLGALLLTPTPTTTPSFPVPTSVPDMVSYLRWSPECQPSVLEMTSACANCFTQQRFIGPSVMRIENPAGQSYDYPVPPLNFITRTYTLRCPVGTCLPESFFISYPITLTADINNQYREPDEENNDSQLYNPPPSCATATSTPTTQATSTATATATRTTVLPTATATAINTAISTATNIVTPAQATNTVIVTNTVVATATQAPCTLTFTDVGENNTFYANIRCLTCRGIVSGYSDGTFRPNNQVTRGQLAKIVSNAAAFSEPVSGQTFQDVPTSHTFYEFVERLAARGYMAGYACGGPGEPCVGARPYFRPQADATRGQTSKIVSNAANFAEPPVGQTFQDVPPTHTFYDFIQRLASRNVMQGYACGGPSEPCVEPENRPYFRPGNNVTRGQSSKIVANAFFPDCNP